jgi:hypothetical protein
MRYFYRLVETDPPTREQFASYYELGVTPPGASGRELHLSKGVSMFETEDQARQASPTMKTRYDFIAEVRVPEDIRAERQGRRAGHHNIYASAGDLLSWVVRVVAVRLDSDREGR